MISERELLKAIQECENAPNSYLNCERLSVFYAIYNQLYGTPAEPSPIRKTEYVVDFESNSEFAEAVNGCESSTAWAVMDELMNALQVLQPRIYNSVLDKFKK